jgi:predicted amidohydrolase
MHVHMINVSAEYVVELILFPEMSLTGYERMQAGIRFVLLISFPSPKQSMQSRQKQ